MTPPLYIYEDAIRLMSYAALAILVTWYEDCRGQDIYFVLTLISRNTKTAMPS